MKHKGIFFITLILLVFSFSVMVSAKVSLSALFMKQAGYQESDMIAMTDEFLKQNPDVEVNLNFVSYEELHDKIAVAAASESGVYDVIISDCVWPAEFAEAGWIIDVTDRLKDEDRADIFPTVLNSVTYKDRIYGMPWLNDWQYFFYNKRMLNEVGASVPTLWPEVIETSQKMKANGIIEYPIIDSWGQGEVVVVQYLTYLNAMGGKAFDENGLPILNQGKGLDALSYMVDNLKAGIYNPASIESFNEEVRRIYSSGQAAFGLNWIYMYNLSNDPQESQIAGDSEIALIPGFPDGNKSASCNGGMGLSIVNTCKNPDVAWDYISFLCSRDIQKKYSANALPIWISLYDDPELIALQPKAIPIAKEQIQYVFDRPQLPWYSQFSQLLGEELQSAITGAKIPQQALDDAVARMKEIQERY